ncbi:hypothetical protein [Robbsia sp. KACC 23696]|uniref:hypothetical protein n=1 Tax=Robbsia sp. KACC 23696 TaxID=3149231 RepID=UPI00325B7B38
MTQTDTLYLEPDTWDWALDANGNIAVASAPYSLAQDAASACRTFLGECYYDTTIGVAYWTDILGQRVSLVTLKAQLVSAAMTVPGVKSARVFVSEITQRTLKGQVQVTDADGVTSVASF